jgi:hypothetical protein
VKVVKQILVEHSHIKFYENPFGDFPCLMRKSVTDSDFIGRPAVLRKPLKGNKRQSVRSHQTRAGIIFGDLEYRDFGIEFRSVYACVGYVYM